MTASHSAETEVAQVVEAGAGGSSGALVSYCVSYWIDACGARGRPAAPSSAELECGQMGVGVNGADSRAQAQGSDPDCHLGDKVGAVVAHERETPGSLYRYGLASEMAYDEEFAHRIRDQLADEDAITEKAMFGGLAFLLRGNMSVGISSTGELMVRVGPDGTDAALSRPHARLFDMTGRPMKGWILVAPEGVKTKRQLGAWVARGVAFARTLPPKG